jgi:hypothetical protein
MRLVSKEDWPWSEKMLPCGICKTLYPGIDTKTDEICAECMTTEYENKDPMGDY